MKHLEKHFWPLLHLAQILISLFRWTRYQQ